MTEIWKDIEGYEGLYQVSNCGRVKRLAGIVKGNWKQGERRQEERALKPLNSHLEYKSVSLSKDGKMTHYLIHRLVAQAFIPNPENLPQVNHKDENKVNNNVENLEWCTSEYNNNYGSHNERSSQAKINGKASKAVLQYSLDGTLVKEWPSVNEIQRQTGWDDSFISKCCRGRYKTAYGYKWSYRTA